VSGLIRPGATAHGVWRPATCGRLKGWLVLGLAAWSGGETAHGAVRDACKTARWRAHRWQGAAGELTGATGRAPDKAVWGGAHPSGGTAWSRWRMLQAAAFIGGDGAPVAGGDGGTAL
jgi:hypothetical protein